MKGELFFPEHKKPTAVLDCQVSEYRKPDDPLHTVYVLYTYAKRPRRRLETVREQPFELRLEDGRRASVIIQHEAIAPDGRIVGTLRVVGGWR